MHMYPPALDEERSGRSRLGSPYLIPTGRRMKCNTDANNGCDYENNTNREHEHLLRYGARQQQAESASCKHSSDDVNPEIN